jgi:hypothetical protein
LKNNPGKSFLDVIGPSDVAYVIALLKNSVDVWKRDWGEDNTEDIAEIAEQDTQTKKTAPKPLFTRGEKVKRKFGRTAWSEEGMEYYKNTLAVWKRMFDRRQAFYGVMSDDWDDWLTEEATVMNPNGWTRKDLQSLLETRSEREVDNSLKQDNSKHAEEDYYSEDEGGPMIGFGIEVREGDVDDEEQFDGKSRDDESYDDNERGGNGKMKNIRRRSYQLKVIHMKMVDMMMMMKLRVMKTMRLRQWSLPPLRKGGPKRISRPLLDYHQEGHKRVVQGGGEIINGG